MIAYVEKLVEPTKILNQTSDFTKDAEVRDVVYLATGPWANCFTFTPQYSFQ